MVKEQLGIEELLAEGFPEVHDGECLHPDDNDAPRGLSAIVFGRLVDGAPGSGVRHSHPIPSPDGPNAEDLIDQFYE